MTPLPDGSFPEVIVVTEAYVGVERRVRSCPCCRKSLEDRPGMLTCGSRECVTAYHHMLHPSMKGYRDRRRQEWLDWWMSAMEQACREAGIASGAE